LLLGRLERVFGHVFATHIKVHFKMGRGIQKPVVVFVLDSVFAELHVGALVELSRCIYPHQQKSDHEWDNASQ
jgi:hypothetical protein